MDRKHLHEREIDRINRQLEANRRLLALSQEIAHIGAWEVHFPDPAAMWTDETFRIMGFAPGEVAPTYESILAMLHPDDRQAVDGAFQRSLQGGKDGYEIEHRIIRPRTGEVRFIRQRCVHQRDANGAVIRSTGTVQDITDEMRAAESLQHANAALQASEALFRNVFEHHAAVKILIEPATGRILNANEAAVAFYGWTKEQLLGMRVHDINTLSPGEVNAELAKTTAAQRVYFEFRHRTAWGIRDVAVYASEIQGGGKPVIHSIIIDITDRKRAEREREAALEAVQQQLREKDVLLRETHHRIKNNITSIQHLLSTQAETVGSPEAVRALQDAAARVSGMRVLYDRMLMADRYEESEIGAYLNGLVDSVVGLLAGGTHVTVAKDIAHVPLGSKKLFPLGLIVNEIVTNAIKHAFAGRAEGVVRIGVVQEGERVRLVLGDDGRGLPEGFRLEDSTGFGLTLVQMLCTQLEGTLTVRSTAAGTEWTLVFPVD